MGLGDGAQHACESLMNDGLHVSWHRGILEILDDDDRQRTGLNESGRGVATSLLNLATPFVRYDTGDQLHWKSFEPSARVSPGRGSGRSKGAPAMSSTCRPVAAFRCRASPS